MSARDDYPFTPYYSLWQTMCDEIDRLRAEVERLSVPAMRWAYKDDE